MKRDAILNFFWYRPTRVVQDQRPLGLNGCRPMCVYCVYIAIMKEIKG